MRAPDSSKLGCVNPNLHGKISLNLVSPNSRRAIRVQTFFLLEGSKIRHQHVEDVVVAGCNHKAGKVSIGLVSSHV